MKLATFLLVLLGLTTLSLAFAARPKGGRPIPTRMPCTGQARYRIFFKYQWTPARFPMDFPPLEDAVFSPLTGAAHMRRFSPYTVFGYANPGVQQIAETGNNAIILEEWADNQFVGNFSASDGPAMYNTNHTIYLTTTPEYTRITALTMVFPSPDWFTGVANREMCSTSGRWLNNRWGLLYPLDGGSDSGITYLSPNQATEPRENIAPILRQPFRGLPVGYYDITRVA